MATKIKSSNYPEEWYCSYHICCSCGATFMTSYTNFCPGCGKKIEEVLICGWPEMEKEKE